MNVHVTILSMLSSHHTTTTANNCQQQLPTSDTSIHDQLITFQHELVQQHVQQQIWFLIRATLYRLKKTKNNQQVKKKKTDTTNVIMLVQGNNACTCDICMNHVIHHMHC